MVSELLIADTVLREEGVKTLHFTDMSNPGPQIKSKKVGVPCFNVFKNVKYSEMYNKIFFTRPSFPVTHPPPTPSRHTGNDMWKDSPG